MKKILALLLLLSSLSWVFTSCGASGGDSGIKRKETPNTSLATALNPESSVSNEDAINTTEKELKSEYGRPDTNSELEVDIDLTKLSSTLVYAEVYNIMMRPESYIGKSIKIRGLYYASFYEVMQKYYHFVIILDATACCEQGLEFVMSGDYNYPDDFPPDETEVEIVGVFESYQEEGETWHRINTKGISVL